MGSHRIIPTYIAWLIVAWLFAPNCVLAILHCQVARQKCVEDDTCALLLDVSYKTCGDTYDGTICRSSSLETCQEALTSVWGNALFDGGCVCSDEERDVECRQLRNFLTEHPCLKIPRINPADPIDNPSCSKAYNLCNSNPKCKKVFNYFRRLCYVQDNRCGIRDRRKCHRAWSKIQQTPIYGCLCQEEKDIEKCVKIYTLVNSNPCVLPEPFPELSTASHVRHDRVTVLVTDVEEGISFPSYEENDSNEVQNSIVSALLGLHATHFHPNIITEPQLSPPPSDMFPSMAIKAKSTCQKAHELCVADLTCQVLLDNMLQVCDKSSVLCNRTECMVAIRNFYELGNPEITHSVAFCICRYNDRTCLIQQHQLHPPCAQRHEVEVPGCHQVATQCRSKPDCSWRMDQFISACAVDQNTIQCRGPVKECRNALINILGTSLRTNCACSGNDFSLLYNCIDWQRLIWLNPCVVQAQKDYHEEKIIPPSPMYSKQGVRPTIKISNNPVTTNGAQPTIMTWVHITTPQLTDPVNLENSCPVKSGLDTVIYIHEGQTKRIYEEENPACSKLCFCNPDGSKTCQHLVCAEKIQCQTPQAIYPHLFRLYRAFRGHCTCFSGNFVCAKPDNDRYSLNPGVYFFLGYSKIEEAHVKNFTNISISNSVHELQKLLDSKEVQLYLKRAKNPKMIFFQFKEKACRMIVSHQIGENVIIQVYLEDFNAERQSNTITADMVKREEKVCNPPLKSITEMINKRHRTVHNHVALSILKEAEVEVHTVRIQGSRDTGENQDMAEPLSSSVSLSSSSLFVIMILLLQLLLHQPP